MKAAVVSGVLGSILLVAPAAATNVSLTTLEGDVYTYNTLASSQFVLWAMLFVISVLCLLLSAIVPRCEDITGLLALTLSAYCTISVPYLQYVEFHVGYLPANDTVVSIVTPIVVEMGSWTIFWACVLLLMVCIVNGMRILFMIAMRDAPSSRMRRREIMRPPIPPRNGEDHDGDDEK